MIEEKNNIEEETENTAKETKNKTKKTFYIMLCIIVLLVLILIFVIYSVLIDNKITYRNILTKKGVTVNIGNFKYNNGNYYIPLNVKNTNKDYKDIDVCVAIDIMYDYDCYSFHFDNSQNSKTGNIFKEEDFDVEISNLSLLKNNKFEAKVVSIEVSNEEESYYDILYKDEKYFEDYESEDVDEEYYKDISFDDIEINFKDFYDDGYMFYIPFEFVNNSNIEYDSIEVCATIDDEEDCYDIEYSDYENSNDKVSGYLFSKDSFFTNVDEDFYNKLKSNNYEIELSSVSGIEYDDDYVNDSSDDNDEEKQEKYKLTKEDVNLVINNFVYNDAIYYIPLEITNKTNKKYDEIYVCLNLDEIDEKDCYMFDYDDEDYFETKKGYVFSKEFANFSKDELELLKTNNYTLEITSIEGFISK